ncbi:disease resistance protein RPP8-like [Ziziphus jujuba]|uniref:Disease resistance protein RPP8-like n=1 Tax=Ziziphus jujuba TaxID=326968 RepID=A0ABM4AAT1_ZIZJJ|nr:disease resistance protein RPP8-like [Ziziphus jujuba]
MEYLGGGHYNLSKLRSLLFFDVDTSPSSCSMSKFLGDGLRFLKVLDCRGAPLDKFPKVILKLYNLRYLSLRETQTIGFKASPGIETLSCLQSLCFIEASQSFTAGLMESLGKLKQLRRLSILKLKESDGYALCSSVQKTRFLYSLSIESENSNEILNLQNISSSPQCLKRLHMSGRLVKLPSWLSSLSCLVRLYLRWSKLEVDPLIHLQALPNLVQLIFEQAYNGKRLRFQTGGFQMLKILMFGKLERLEEVLVEEGSMPRLEELWFRDCKLLKKVPCGVGFLTELKYLEFVDMAPELIRRLGRSKIYEDYDKIKHVPSIFTGNQRDWGVDGNYLNA